jgi:hypothetical protein
MRDANAQRTHSIVCVSAARQPSEPHVSHAETDGCNVANPRLGSIAQRTNGLQSWREKKTNFQPRFGSEILFTSRGEDEEALQGARIRKKDYDGQRCALLTTKSRNTCTRATVFNSSG